MGFESLQLAIVISPQRRSLTSGTASPWSAAVGEGTMWNQKGIIVVGTLLFFIIFMLTLVPLAKCIHRIMTLERRREREMSLANAGLKQRIVQSFPTIVYQEHPSLSSVAVVSLCSSASSSSSAPSPPHININSSSSDCSICLSQFSQGEILRLMPSCFHGFHVACIDAWLLCHSSCPICRRNLLPQQQIP